MGGGVFFQCILMRGKGVRKGGWKCDACKKEGQKKFSKPDYLRIYPSLIAMVHFLANLIAHVITHGLPPPGHDDCVSHGRAKILFKASWKI